MIDRIMNVIADVSLTKQSGKFLADKSYGFDTIFFIAKFIKHNAADNKFNKELLRRSAIEYIEDIFQLISGTAGAVNYFAETINLLEYANVIEKSEGKSYVIKAPDILDYITERPENAYIFVYLITYKTFVNDNIMPLYARFCQTTDIDEKVYLVSKIHSMFTEKSVSIEDGGQSNWSKQLVKYAFIVLGYINKQNIITRTLNVKNSHVKIEDISLNVAGTRTPVYLPKHNDYLYNFSFDYISFELQKYLLCDIQAFDSSKIVLVDSLAQNLADLKLVMQDEFVNGVLLNEEEREQYITNTVKTRNQAVQRKFKKDLLDNNKHCCPICGFAFEEFLIASHIKPYSKCEHTYDAINHFNGLLMCPNHDKLFENAKHMTIDCKSGRVFLSEAAKASKEYGMLQGKIIPSIYINNEREKYLKWHNERFITTHN